MNKTPNPHEKSTNEELIKAIQNGEDKFEEFVGKNYGLFSRMAYYYSSRSLLEYDDLLNRFMYIAWNCVNNFDFNARIEFSTFFFKSCKNETLNLMRTKEYKTMKKTCSLYNKVPISDGEELEYIDLIESNYEIFTYEEFLKEYCEKVLLSRIGELKTNVTIDYFFNRLPINQIAQKYNLSSTTTINYKNHGRQILRRELSKNWL